MKMGRPVMLLILDGWGWREETADNAVRLADTPTFDHLWHTCPCALLRASGTDVGLPEGQISHPELLMMQSSQDRNGDNDTRLLDWSIGAKRRTDPISKRRRSHS
jgi:hypothetical protein